MKKTIAVVVGIMLDETVFKPLIQGVTDGLPCPTNEKWLGTCLDLKKVLIVSPYFFTFAGIYGVLRIAAGDKE